MKVLLSCAGSPPQANADQIVNPSDLNLRSRRNLRWEQLTELSLPASFALLEGSFCAILADKMFAAPGWVLALLTSAPMWANLSSAFWSPLTRGWPKVPTILTLQALTLACLGVVVMLPQGDQQLGLALLVAAMVAGRLLISGIITVRSVVWSLNYHRDVRARSTARLHTLTSVVTVSVASLAGLALDNDPGYFRWIYAAGLLPGIVGIWCFWHVDVPGELRQRIEERRARTIATKSSLGGLRILWSDRNYGRYMLHQFISGLANMGIEAPIVYLVSRELGASFLASISITLVIPFVTGLLALPFWAKYLDRSHVVRFRYIQSYYLLACTLMLWLGAELGSLLVIGIARVIGGLVRSAGGIAWQIGHNDFAPRAGLSAYMSVHVTLTGIRGAIAPFLFMALYLGIGGWSGLGPSVFLFATVVACVSAWGFWRLKRDLGA